MDPSSITVDTRHWKAISDARNSLLNQAAAVADLLTAYGTQSYVQEGYSSIFDFAWDELQIDPVSVNRIIALLDTFRDLPRMRWLLETGEVHWSVLSAVADVVTEDSEEIWADTCYRFYLDKFVVERLAEDCRTGLLRFDCRTETSEGEAVPPDTPLN